MAKLGIAVIVGSLRRESFTGKYARALIEAAPSTLALGIVEIGNLPLYNQDFDDENRPPAEWTAFRDAVRAVDGVLFATPEYNRSVPGVLKNAIDVGSRPYGKSVWSGKPCGVVSVSPGAIGGFGANHHIRQCLVFLDMPVLQQPEAYMGGADKTLDGERIAKPETREFLGKYMQAFASWVEHHAHAAAEQPMRAQGGRR
jgi:chromate reductase